MSDTANRALERRYCEGRDPADLRALLQHHLRVENDPARRLLLVHLLDDAARAPEFPNEPSDRFGPEEGPEPRFRHYHLVARPEVARLALWASDLAVHGRSVLERVWHSSYLLGRLDREVVGHGLSGMHPELEPLANRTGRIVAATAKAVGTAVLEAALVRELREWALGLERQPLEPAPLQQDPVRYEGAPPDLVLRAVARLGWRARIHRHAPWKVGLKTLEPHPGGRGHRQSFIDVLWAAGLDVLDDADRSTGRFRWEGIRGDSPPQNVEVQRLSADSAELRFPQRSTWAWIRSSLARSKG